MKTYIRVKNTNDNRYMVTVKEGMCERMLRMTAIYKTKAEAENEAKFYAKWLKAEYEDLAK